MEFLQNLSEARLFGSGRSGIRYYNAKEIADLLFLHICALQVLKHEFYTLPEAQAYVKRAGNVVNFDYYVQSRNEVYVMFHILIGKHADRQRDMLKDQKDSQAFLDTINVNLQHSRKYLRLILAGRMDESFERRYLLELERGLRIDNSYYRSIRRLVSSWPKQPEATKRLVMTRLLQIFRAKARRSELLPLLEWLAKKEHMADKDLEPLPNQGLGQNQSKKGSNFLKTLAVAGAGAAAGYYLTRNKKK